MARWFVYSHPTQKYLNSFLVLENIENDDPVWVESSHQFPISREDTQHKSISTKASNDSSNSQAKIEKIRIPPGFF